MPRYKCIDPPAEVTIAIGQQNEVYLFPDQQPVEVSPELAVALEDDPVFALV